jgi:hypothetical protein
MMHFTNLTLHLCVDYTGANRDGSNRGLFDTKG